MAGIDVLAGHETGDRSIDAQIGLHAAASRADLEPEWRHRVGHPRQRMLDFSALGFGFGRDAGGQRRHQDALPPDLSKGGRGRSGIKRHQRRANS